MGCAASSAREPWGWAAEQCPDCLTRLPVFRDRDGRALAYSSRLQRPTRVCAHLGLLRGEPPRRAGSGQATAVGAAMAGGKV